VILGTDKLNQIGPWLPARRGRLWIACGDFIEPVLGRDKHAARAEMAARIERALVELYAQLRREYGLEDSILP
jgi:1-acyl-sn-glycerol-3-phosphate acyltransferase